MVLALSFVATVLLLIFLWSTTRALGEDRQRLYDPCLPRQPGLTAEVDGYTHNRRRDLAAARSDLMREVKTVGSFDDQLGTVSFPSAAATAAAALIQADQKLAKLIGLQARAPSLRKMRSFDSRVEAAAAVVKTQVGLIRRDLGLPPSSGPLF